jgi:hypothetical protein
VLHATAISADTKSARRELWFTGEVYQV